jgi:hypothetical protein
MICKKVTRVGRVVRTAYERENMSAHIVKSIIQYRVLLRLHRSHWEAVRKPSRLEQPRDDVGSCLAFSLAAIISGWDTLSRAPLEPWSHVRLPLFAEDVSMTILVTAKIATTWTIEDA